MKKYDVEIGIVVEVQAKNDEQAKMLAKGFVMSLEPIGPARLSAICSEAEVNELS